MKGRKLWQGRNRRHLLAFAIPPFVLAVALLVAMPHHSSALDVCEQPSAATAVVQSGNSLEGIASTYYGASACAAIIAQANGIGSSSDLYSGEVLMLAPASALAPTAGAGTFSWGVIGGPTRTPPTAAPTAIPNAAPQGPSSTLPLAPPPSNGFIWPVTGPITQLFGVPELGVGTPHTGIDIGVPQGTPVHAAADGRVTFAGGDPCCGLGYWVEINHGNRYVTRYGHMMRPPIVLTGDYVHQGDIIGFSGDTGFSTGPHVHFEIRLDGTPIDPLRLLPSGQ